MNTRKGQQSGSANKNEKAHKPKHYIGKIPPTRQAEKNHTRKKPESTERKTRPDDRPHHPPASRYPSPNLRHRRCLVRQSRRMVRLLRVLVLRPLLRARILPQWQYDHTIAQHRWCLRSGLSDAPDRRLVLRPPRRQERPSHRDDDLRIHDVRRFTRDRRTAHLRADRRAGTRAAACRATVPGPVGRRGVRHERHLHE